MTVAQTDLTEQLLRELTVDGTVTVEEFPSYLGPGVERARNEGYYVVGISFDAGRRLRRGELARYWGNVNNARQWAEGNPCIVSGYEHNIEDPTDKSLDPASTGIRFYMDHPNDIRYREFFERERRPKGIQLLQETVKKLAAEGVVRLV